MSDEWMDTPEWAEMHDLLSMCSDVIVSKLREHPHLWSVGRLGHGDMITGYLSTLVIGEVTKLGIETPITVAATHSHRSRSHDRIHRLADRDGWSCRYCGVEVSCRCDDPNECPGVADHVLPLSRGGPDEDHNLVVACWPCNSDKGDKTPSEWGGR